MSLQLSFVIPTLNEALYLPALLSDLARVRVPHEVIVADGGSRDMTCEHARRHGARVVVARRGRGPQLNAGAAAARGKWLCFLHADVRMPEAARAELERSVGDARVEAAVWRLAIDASGVWPRVMEAGAFVRDRVFGLPYGDQGLLVQHAVFADVGGYPDLPIMEDVTLIRELRRRVRLVRLGAPLLVSARRWRREGAYRTWFRNSLLLAAYTAKLDSRLLARWYPPERG